MLPFLARVTDRLELVHTDDTAVEAQGEPRWVRASEVTVRVGACVVTVRPMSSMDRSRAYWDAAQDSEKHGGRVRIEVIYDAVSFGLVAVTNLPDGTKMRDFVEALPLMHAVELSNIIGRLTNGDSDPFAPAGGERSPSQPSGETTSESTAPDAGAKAATPMSAVG